MEQHLPEHSNDHFGGARYVMSRLVVAHQLVTGFPAWAQAGLGMRNLICKSLRDQASMPYHSLVTKHAILDPAFNQKFNHLLQHMQGSKNGNNTIV